MPKASASADIVRRGSQSPTTAASCCACGCPLGIEAKELPFRVPEDNGEGGGKYEIFCPQDFVYLRGPRDPRWHDAIRLGQILPIRCGGCGLTTVAFGRRACSHCGSRSVVLLTPKNTVLSAALLKGLARA